jgi:hypothetical protein
MPGTNIFHVYFFGFISSNAAVKSEYIRFQWNIIYTKASKTLSNVKKPFYFCRYTITLIPDIFIRQVRFSNGPY